MPSWLREYGNRQAFLVGFGLALLLLLTGIWQLTAVAALVAGILRRRPSRAFLVGFLSIAAAWGGFYLAYFLLTPAADLMALFSAVLGLGAAAWPAVLLIMLLLAGLLGGFFSLVGALGIQLVVPPREAVGSGPT